MIESYPDYQRNMMENYPDYSSEEYLDGWGWHEDQVVPVPGFGFFPSIMKEELEEEAQVLLIDFTLSALSPFLTSLLTCKHSTWTFAGLPERGE